MEALSATAAAIRESRLRARLSQRELARRAGTAQSVVARIESGQTNPTIETVMQLVAAAGFALDVSLVPQPALDQVVEAYKRDIDRSLLRQNLSKSVNERIMSLQALALLAEEAKRARTTARRRR
jgi:transcriptional regulator with XRE-family HTH domain